MGRLIWRKHLGCEEVMEKSGRRRRRRKTRKRKRKEKPLQTKGV